MVRDTRCLRSEQEGRSSMSRENGLSEAPLPGKMPNAPAVADVQPEVKAVLGDGINVGGLSHGRKPESS
jgi:hypothetical protein